MRVEILDGPKAAHEMPQWDRNRAFHLRIWLGDPPDLGGAAATVLHSIAPFGAGHLEFWDARPVVQSALAHLKLVAHEIVPKTLVAYDVNVEALAKASTALAAESFGVWLGIPASELRAAMAHSSTRARVAALPKGAMFAIMSLYDDNVELFIRPRDCERTLRNVLALH